MADTIFAVGTARGRSGIAVVRISGPEALPAVKSMVGSFPPARQAGLRRVRDPDSGEILDEGLVVLFPGPASFTGEDSVELHLHGSSAVVDGVLGALGRLSGLRPAEAGEFTRRAFQSGRLDLAQVEALGDLIVSETAAQRRQALAAMQGRVGKLSSSWTQDIVRYLAMVEVAIDFADEDLPSDLLAATAAELDGIAHRMRSEVAGSRIAERLREGFEVALVGRPNVGKSTLLNALAGRDAALTSPIAGTTRDVIEVRMDLGGLPLTVLDTAGLREAESEIEGLGIARARARAEAADLRIVLVEDPADVAALGLRTGPDDVVVRAKADLSPDRGGISGVTGAGIDELLSRVETILSQRVAAAGSLAHRRQREAVGEAAERAAGAARELRLEHPRVEIAAEELRRALRALDFLVGRVDVEAVLDVIFASFCLGK